MNRLDQIEFIDNPAIGERSDHYTIVFVDVAKTLQSWQSSLFSFEWMLPDGEIKRLEELPEKEQVRRQEVEKTLESAQPIAKPVLGIGLMENIEIGMGRAEFLTLAAHGLAKIPVHIPKSNESDFKGFLADIE